MKLRFARLEEIGEQEDENGYYECSKCLHQEHREMKAVVALVPEDLTGDDACRWIWNEGRHAVPYHYLCAHCAEVYPSDSNGEIILLS